MWPIIAAGAVALVAGAVGVFEILHKKVAIPLPGGGTPAQGTPGTPGFVPAQTAQQNAQVVAQTGMTVGQAAAKLQQADNATNQQAAALQGSDAGQKAQFCIDTPQVIEAMERAAHGLSLDQLNGIATAAGTTVVNMLTVSFAANPGGDPMVIAPDVAATIEAMQ